MYNLHTHNLLGLSFSTIKLDNSELIYELIKPPNEGLPFLEKNCIFLTHSINV